MVEFLTVPEVAGILRISSTHVYRLLQNGQMPHLRAGQRRYLITREQLDDYIREQSVAAKSVRDAS